jgi:hypothetical protein
MIKKKAMKLKTISFCILLVGIIISCKKEELFVADNSEVMFLSEVISDDQPYYQYSYNDSNLISEESSKLDFLMHHYNNKNQLVSSDYFWNNSLMSSDIKAIETTLAQSDMVTSANSSKGGSIVYEYNSSGQLAKAIFNRLQSANSEYSVFSYDENNRINKQILYWNSVETGYIEYSYDGKGNLTREILYDQSASGVAEPSTTTKYVFDNKQNPYKTFNSLMIPGINTNRNNVTKEIYIIHVRAGIGGEKVQATENSYEYNINGYPVSKNGNVQYIYE